MPSSAGHDAVQTLLFYGAAAVSLWLAWAVVTSRRILRAAVSLMGVLGASAALYLLLGLQFLAGVQVLVYVGGIVVLLVFAIMLTRTQALLEDHPSDHRHKIGVLAAGALFAANYWALQGLPQSPQAPAPADDTAQIGKALLDAGPDGYALPFEAVSLLLLAAMIGAIVIARKDQAPAAASAPSPVGELAHD